MYIETSYPRLNREAAHLISPQISSADGNCLSFFYHMHGLNIRELAVYAQSVSGSRHVLWRLSGEFGDAWKFASVPINIPQDLTIKVAINNTESAFCCFHKQTITQLNTCMRQWMAANVNSKIAKFLNVLNGKQL